ncbi:MAG: hypothetical protein AAGH65_08905, partial [Pseudomonadota bacterium]
MQLIIRALIYIGIIFIGVHLPGSLRADEPAQSREELYRSFLQDELRTNPLANEGGHRLETDPDFLRRYFGLLH